MNLVMQTLGRAVEPLFGTGVGRIPGVAPLYKFIWRRFGPKGVRLVNTLHGFNLYVNCRDWAVAPSLVWAHVWEPAETELFLQHVKEGMTVLDIGAHIGYYSLLASRLVGKEGRVYAFEPSPESYDLLLQNLELNDVTNAKPVQRAVSDKTGITELYLSRDSLASNTTSRAFPDWQPIEVQCVRLDTALKDVPVDFIKMDIEGGETRALNGMLNILERNPNLEMIVEVYPKGLAGAGSSLEEYIRLLRRYFRLYIIRKHGLTEETRLGDIRRAVRRAGSINLFCRRKSD